MFEGDPNRVSAWGACADIENDQHDNGARIVQEVSLQVRWDQRHDQWVDAVRRWI